MQDTAPRTGNQARVLITLAALFVIFRLMSLNRVRLADIDFDEAPAWAYTATNRPSGHQAVRLSGKKKPEPFFRSRLSDCLTA